MSGVGITAFADRLRRQDDPGVLAAIMSILPFKRNRIAMRDKLKVRLDNARARRQRLLDQREALTLRETSGDADAQHYLRDIRSKLTDVTSDIERLETAYENAAANITPEDEAAVASAAEKRRKKARGHLAGARVSAATFDDAMAEAVAAAVAARNDLAAAMGELDSEKQEEMRHRVNMFRSELATAAAHMLSAATDIGRRDHFYWDNPTRLKLVSHIPGDEIVGS